MERFTYIGSKTKEISFPLGGIGAGCIGLSGNGRLIDWEIFNKPNKGSANGFSHFAIKVEADGKLLDARVMNGDLPAPYIGEYNKPNFQSYGFGPHRNTLAGIPHFKDVEFEGTYPFATLRYFDDKFPGKVAMTAFNPFIPLNDEDSSIPGAFFEIEVENILDIPATYTIGLSLNNPLTPGAAINRYINDGKVHIIKFTSSKHKENELEYGDLCIATDTEDVSWQEYWYRGSWFDNLGIYWRDFSAFGKFKNRNYEYAPSENKQQPGDSDVGTLAVHAALAPGEKKKFKFVVTWNYPNCTNYWNPEKCGCTDSDCSTVKPKTWKNYYTSLFLDSQASAVYSLENWERLYGDTLIFKNALFSSTLPVDAIDAISANMSILKSPTCLRLEDGSFYGFEGCHCDGGCCEGSCTHVWNYAYSLPFLFPKLERSMRDLDFKYNQQADGGMAFRLMLPPGREPWGFRPCADGQFGGVIKTYREWKISGDLQWLKSNWEAVKKSIEYAWAPTNEDQWDPERLGVLGGRQHHTLDMELFGPNSWLTGFYLAALKAGAEMAEYLGEKDKAFEYLTIFNKGKKWVDENLFNGEYYQQQIDLKDKNILEKYNNSSSLLGNKAVDSYWNWEANEMKYQIGEGCSIDQVLAQWHANLCGLGEIFDKSQVRKALQSIYQYNFKKTMRDFYNPCRLYTLNDEAGVVICDWPAGKYKPIIPIPYAEETMYGFEYQVAIHMIQEGMMTEGMEIISAIRSRFDGEKRNPWNEFECGSNYARSMASYALLNTFCGFKYDMSKGMIEFNPLNTTFDTFKCFWALDSGWGVFEANLGLTEIKLLYGELNLKTIRLPFLDKFKIKTVSMGGSDLQFSIHEDYIQMTCSTKIIKGNSLTIVTDIM